MTNPELKQMLTKAIDELQLQGIARNTFYEGSTTSKMIAWLNDMIQYAEEGKPIVLQIDRDRMMDFLDGKLTLSDFGPKDEPCKVIDLPNMSAKDLQEYMDRLRAYKFNTQWQNDFNNLDIKEARPYLLKAYRKQVQDFIDYHLSRMYYDTQFWPNREDAQTFRDGYTALLGFLKEVMEGEES